jgi:hypothetical protein
VTPYSNSKPGEISAESTRLFTGNASAIAQLIQIRAALAIASISPLDVRARSITIEARTRASRSVDDVGLLASQIVSLIADVSESTLRRTWDQAREIRKISGAIFRYRSGGRIDTVAESLIKIYKDWGTVLSAEQSNQMVQEAANSLSEVPGNVTVIGNPDALTQKGRDAWVASAAIVSSSEENVLFFGFAANLA